MSRAYKVDLHVHSSYSNKPTSWTLRKFNCPESYTRPDFIYHSALKKGMDYVTISDHNSINGALEIAHLPGTFISTEVTTIVPDNGCKLHVVTLDITESMFGDIMHLRNNIYELVGYLQKNNIAHFLAHLLYDMNGRLTLETIEKTLLLFDTFEVKNGSRSGRYNRLISDLVTSLTPQQLERLAVKHGINPVGREPWIKAVVGGSDDHSGFFIGRAYTSSLQGATLKDFINSIRERSVWADGEDGDALTLSHSIYGIGYRFFKEKIEPRQKNQFPFISALLNRVFGANSDKSSLFDKINLFIKKNIPEVYDGHDGKSLEQILDREAKRLLNDTRFLQTISSEDVNRKVFAVTSYLVNRLLFIYTERLTREYPAINILELANSLGTIGLVHFLASPYYVAYHHQHRSKALVRALTTRFALPASNNGRQKIALFTDTLHEINGVAITIKRLIETAKAREIELVVITASERDTGFSNGVMNFKSIGEFSLPEYPDLKLHFPPVLDIIDYFDRQGFTRIHSSTPGTMGLLSLFIAKLMDIPVSGTYHTDIPQYVKSLTGDTFLEDAAWNYMIWFYNAMDEVMVPSSSTRTQLIEKGLASGKVKPLPRWVDSDAFSPGKRDPNLWLRYGLDGAIKFLYVGRLSREKNLELLANAFLSLADSGDPGNLVLVGDGPYRKELEDKLKGYPVLFTGFLSGEELSRAYASADVFVFPSTTDTFGNVVLEAQASGLPVIVSDQGGPKELLDDGKTGFIIKGDNTAALVDAMRRFITDSHAASIMGSHAREFIESNSPQANEVYSTILHHDLQEVSP
ncbi:MAG TPA: glycosyltransferase [Nitrospirota bacterium]|nr:glycosyltransferase [Nitrospirota bacterium]